jgi:hypothetical protein
MGWLEHDLVLLELGLALGLSAAFEHAFRGNASMECYYAYIDFRCEYTPN